MEIIFGLIAFALIVGAGLYWALKSDKLDIDDIDWRL
jgi:hypothetical protein